MPPTWKKPPARAYLGDYSSLAAGTPVKAGQLVMNGGVLYSRKTDGTISGSFSGANWLPAGTAGAGKYAFRDPEAPLLAKGKPMVVQPTVDAPSTAAATIASGTGNTTSGSPSVTSVATTTGAFVVGQDITGPGIPANTVIKSISGTTITLGSRTGVNVNATATAAGVALTATLGTTFAWTHNGFRALSAQAVVAGATFPDNGYGKGIPPSGANAGTSIAWETFLNIQHYEILVKGNGTRLRLWEEEDGELRLVTTGAFAGGYCTMPNNGSGYRIHVDRGSRVGRRIRIEGASSFFFGGIKAIASATLAPPPEPVGPTVVVAGDSFTEGTGVTPSFLGFPWKAGFLAGFRNVHVSGLGSTGYLNDGTAGRMRLSARFDADIARVAPDVLVLCMGINDTSLDTTALRAEVDLVLSKVLALPKVPVTVVMGAFFGGNSQAGPTKTVTDVIEAAFNAVKAQLPVGSRFVDNDAEAWQTGTGNVAATVGDGNNDHLVGSDTTHPNGEPAHDYHGERLAPHLMGATA